MIWKFILHRQPISLQLTHLAGIAGEHFNAAGSAARVAPTAVQNVDARILDDQD